MNSMTAQTPPSPVSEILHEPPEGGASLQRKVVLANPNGLHMRPSAAFVELAGRFESNVTVHHDGKSVNGKSLWDLLLLAALPGCELVIEAEGPDAAQALEALAALIQTVPPDT